MWYTTTRGFPYGEPIWEQRSFLMKKLLFGIAATLLVVALAGCPTDDNGKKDDSTPQDGPSTPSEWTKGITDFGVVQGDEPGEIKYSFSATDPSAGVTYTLYWAKGTKSTATEIMTAADGDDMPVSPGNNQVWDEGTAGQTYSFVVVAEKTDFGDAKSAVKTATAKPNPPPPTGGKTITISGSTGGVTVYGVLLFSNIEDMMAENDPDVYGYSVTNTSPYAFIDPNTFTAWNGSGHYYIVLECDDDDYYVYTNGAELDFEEMTGPVTYNFTQASTSIGFDKFKYAWSGDGHGSIPLTTFTGLKKITVNNIPSDVTFIMIGPFDPEETEPLALGFMVSGGYLSTTVTAPDTSTGTCTTPLYEAADAMNYLYMVREDLPATLPDDYTYTGSAVIGAMYADTTTGEDPDLFRVWITTAPGGDTLVVDWSAGFDIDFDD